MQLNFWLKTNKNKTLISSESDKKENIRDILLLVAVILFVLLSFGFIFFKDNYGIGIIKSPSVDKSILLYKRHFNNEDLQKDRLVFFLMPVESIYFKKDSKFGKYIRCKEGEVLTIKNLDYFCEGKFIGSAKTKDKDGRDIKTFVFNGVIPKDKFFVMGTHERSFDSRYWGFVDKNRIKGVSIWDI